jgi:hypothetical protein
MSIKLLLLEQYLKKKKKKLHITDNYAYQKIIKSVLFG